MSTNPKVPKIILINAISAFGLVITTIGLNTIRIRWATIDPIAYCVPAAVLIIVGLATMLFGLDVFMLGEDIDRWDPWE